MAREKHLTGVYIDNFKRFKDFKVENLGQFNLLVGDNSTGKTSFLEALVLDGRSPNNTKNLIKLLTARKSKAADHLNIKNVVELYGNEQDDSRKLVVGFTGNEDNELVVISDLIDNNTINIINDINSIYNNYNNYNINNINNHYVNLMSNLGAKFEFVCNYIGLDIPNNKKIINFDLNNKKLGQVKFSNDPSETEFLNFMPFGVGYDNDLEKVYDDKIEQSRIRMDQLIEQLKLFIPNVVDLRLRKGEITIYESDKDLGMPLYTYGEGAVKFFRILCYMSVAEGKRLMIDEIDTGIHHTKFVRFWKTLMQAATAYDVQIFATTHNEECLKYYIKALELDELEEQRKLGRVIHLAKAADNSVVPRVYEWEELLVAEELNHELRGSWA